MPIQRFAPMTKDFATFDCDAHVTEPPLIWERAKDFLTRDDLDALKRTIWWDADGRLLIVNGRAGTHRKVQYMQGSAEILDPHNLRMKLTAGGDEHVQFEHAILATGSIPAIPRFMARSPSKCATSWSRREFRGRRFKSKLNRATRTRMP